MRRFGKIMMTQALMLGVMLGVSATTIRIVADANTPGTLSEVTVEDADLGMTLAALFATSHGKYVLQRDKAIIGHIDSLQLVHMGFDDALKAMLRGLPIGCIKTTGDNGTVVYHIDAILNAAQVGSPDLTISVTAPAILPTGAPVQAPNYPIARPVARYSWQETQAAVAPTGDLVWSPHPFVFHPDPQARYIDYAAGNDANEGTKAFPWQHHPWDVYASGNAAACAGVHTFIFKGGVVYRGTLIAKESGKQGEPIRLTHDPSWGTGEAVISGAKAIIGGWKVCDAASAPGIPTPEKCWYLDIGTQFVPRALWAEGRRGIVRIPIARTPHWESTDPNDPRTGWNVWSDLIRLPTGELKDGKPATGAHGKPFTQAWAVDAKNLTQIDPNYYVGATLWSEYIGMMGTPYPQIVKQYDPDKHAIAVESCWGGKDEQPGYFSYEPVKFCRYFLENLPQFLDAPGEYYFAEKGPNAGRLFVRLPGDVDPNTVTIEAAREFNLIDIPNQSHIEISGLAFRYENVWRWQDRWYENLDVAPACVRMRGSCADIRVANCSFDHVAEAVRTTAKSASNVFDDIEVSDNDISNTDHGGMTFTSGWTNTFPMRLRVLRNRLFDIGDRPIRSEHSVAIIAGAAQYLEVAGNIIDRAYGSGCMILGGWGEGKGPGEIPCLRMFVHHNKVTNSLLHTCDWGAIDVWKAGGFVYDNIVGNPVGAWNPPNNAGKRNGQGFAFYTNGPDSIHYNIFNNIAWGRTNDIDDPTFNFGAFFPGHSLHAWVNNTAYRFKVGVRVGSSRSLCDLGNLYVDMHDACQPAELSLGSSEAQRKAKLGGFAISKNVYIGKLDHIWVFDDRGVLPTLEEARHYLVAGTPIVGDIGTVFAEAPSLHDAEHQDFRLLSNSPAVGQGVKYFMPFPLNHEVGVWKFHQNPVDPTAIRDDHVQLNDEWGLFWTNNDQVRHDLRWQGDTAMPFVDSPLEDWIPSALALDGQHGYCAIHQQGLQQDITEAKTGKVLLAGTDRRTPDMHNNNFLVEAYFSTAPGQTGGTIVSKGTGYAFDLDLQGHPRLSLQGADGQGSRMATVTVNDGKWHHVIVEADRADASGIHLYVDGKLHDGAFAGVMPKASLTTTDDLLVGKGLSGAISFLRMSQGTLHDANTTIDELYAWEFDGPMLHDFMGVKPAGKRDAGAFQHTN